MRLRIVTLYVDDQDRALRFYTETLGFVPRADVGSGSYRWLTVASADDTDGPELHLAPNGAPVVRAYQEGMRAAGSPALMLFVGDVAAEHERLTRAGATFTMPVTRTPGSRIAVLDDGCGNLIQLTQLDRG